MEAKNGGDLEKVGEESPTFAEDAAEHFGNGKDELAVRDGMADAGGDPFGGLAGAALMAGGADVAGLAGEGEMSTLNTHSPLFL